MTDNFHEIYHFPSESYIWLEEIIHSSYEKFKNLNLFPALVRLKTKEKNLRKI